MFKVPWISSDFVGITWPTKLYEITDSHKKYMSHLLVITVLVTYRKTSNISRTLVGNIIVDNSDAAGASPVGAAPTTSSFST